MVYRAQQPLPDRGQRGPLYLQGVAVEAFRNRSPSAPRGERAVACARVVGIQQVERQTRVFRARLYGSLHRDPVSVRGAGSSSSSSSGVMHAALIIALRFVFWLLGVLCTICYWSTRCRGAAMHLEPK